MNPKHPTDIAFGRRVKNRRRDLKLTQLVLAVKADVPPSTVSYAEAGNGITIRNALRLARVLDINIMSLPVR